MYKYCLGKQTMLLSLKRICLQHIESDETIRKRSPLFGSFVEKLRKHQDVLPELFSQL